ncbi:hypothetical protein V2J52_15800 [Georgenia sp. MJ173]|uniref:DUF6912 family protein n=1 Tax=Georgenia sunbinii TaxID=3117728 RepID=UPI002F264699
MRIYLPATSEDLRHPEGLAPRAGHTVTPALRRALPEEDDDGLADSALLAAADESVVLLRSAPGAAARRVVVAVDVAEEDVDVPRLRRPWQPGDDRLPSAVDVRATVPWRDVASIHVDEDDAAADVAAAIASDHALDRAAERDLLWHDVTERESLVTDLAAAAAASPTGS